jgi:hypothetical protein
VSLTVLGIIAVEVGLFDAILSQMIEKAGRFEVKQIHFVKGITPKMSSRKRTKTNYFVTRGKKFTAMRKLDRFVEVFGRRDLVFELIKNRTRLFLPHTGGYIRV